MKDLFRFEIYSPVTVILADYFVLSNSKFTVLYRTFVQDTGLGLDITWPAGIGSGVEFWLQAWMPYDDGGSLSGILASNGMNFVSN